MKRNIAIPILYVLCLVLLIAKSPDALIHPQLWAEDGAIFFAQQHSTLLPLIFKPYAGYLHIIPRSIAWTWMWVPARWVPLVYNVSAIIIEAIVLTFAIWRLSTIYPLVLCLVGVFCLPTVGDIFGTMTNIQWFAQLALAAAVFVKPPDIPSRYSPTRWLLLVAVILWALSGPFSVNYALIVACAWLFERIARSLAFTKLVAFGSFAIDRQAFGAMLVGAIPQVVTIALSRFNGQLKTPESEYTLTIAEAQQYNVKLTTWYSLVIHPIEPVNIVLVVFFLLITASIVFRVLRSGLPEDITSALLLGIGWLSPVLAFAKQHAIHTLSSLSHYWYFLGVISVCCSARALPASLGRVGSLVAAPVILLLLLIWQPELAFRPALQDLRWDSYAEAIERNDGSVTVPLNPAWRAVVTPRQ